jgi:ATP-dependent DNA helicase RecG
MELAPNSSIEFIKGIGTEKTKVLTSTFGIETIKNLVEHFPYRHVDRSILHTTANVPIDGEAQIKGEISNLKEVAYGVGKKRLVATFKDEFGTVELVWFKITNFLIRSILIQVPVVIYGKITQFNGKLSISHPEIELYSTFLTKNIGLSSMYPNTDKTSKKGITNRWYQSIYQQIFIHNSFKVNENLSEKIIKEYRLISRIEALKNLHLPENKEKLDQAYFRLKFEEIFFFQLQFGIKKLSRIQHNRGNSFQEVGYFFNEFYSKHLPFSLTDAQKRVIREIRLDMKKNTQMNRLLQGDVGSGKTVVALFSMLIAIDNGFQACLMTPTEILSQQHFQSISDLILPLGIEIEILTGSTTQKKRKEIDEKLQNGTLKILIGTHALLEDKVQFKNLGLAIIDEQHRFGVAQRAKLWNKNTIPPHILVMTATPIPRTLAMSYYSDLDLSVIDELPKGRKPIKTIHIIDEKRFEIIHFIREQIQLGRQVYIVYPLIEESQQLDYKNLIDGFDYLSSEFPTPKYQISIVHGQMKPKEKDLEMQKFASGISQIMVATTVIEVGVNVPNASIMIIENSERFGLSQLHQLRGRVGRGSEQSYCILVTKPFISNDAKRRIQVMCETNDGFKISEVDMELRGAGNILGTQQSGTIDFKLTDLIEDKTLVYQTKQLIDKILTEDSTLSKTDNLPIKKYFTEEYKSSIEWGKIS